MFLTLKFDDSIRVFIESCKGWFLNLLTSAEWWSLNLKAIRWDLWLGGCASRCKFGAWIFSNGWDFYLQRYEWIMKP